MRKQRITKQQTLDNLDKLLMEFDVNVDTHFKAGDSENGLAAFEQWQADVHSWLNSLSGGRAEEFSDTTKRRAIKPHARETLRSQFLRSRGAKPIMYLRKLQKGLTGGTITIEDLRDHHGESV